MQRLSIIIANYNYGAFVSAAIDSALSVDWPDTEVIVVDDGSTDHSRDVIRRYAGRITILEQENAGQRRAANNGFAVSSGDVVLFLDSDDVLNPTIAREVAAVWRAGLSKVQVQMQRIGRDGAPSGGVFPEFAAAPTPTQIRRWMVETSAYPTPPGSGNAYSRQFLDQIFPLDGRCGEASDSAPLAAAPYLGDVVTIVKPLVGYRLHGDNDSDLMANPHERFPSQIATAYRRHLYAMDISGNTAGRDALMPLFRSRHLLQLRVADRRLNPGTETPIPTDSVARLFRDSFRAVAAPGPEPLSQRIAVMAWCLATLMAPSAQATRLIQARYRRTPIASAADQSARDATGENR
jgi:glycosyltransferase involved in cell wall biosynthesis